MTMTAALMNITTMTDAATIINIQKEAINMFVFNHFNYNVLDLEKSIKFYEEALGLKESTPQNKPF